MKGKKNPHRINDLTGEEEKFCNICKRWVPVRMYSNKKASYDGLETRCKECIREKNKKFRDEKPEYIKQYNEDNKEKLKEYRKDYYRRSSSTKKQEEDLENLGLKK